MNTNSNERMKTDNLLRRIHAQKCDPLFTRLFKSESDYLDEGYKEASDVYARIIEELNEGFLEMLSKLEETDEEKKKLINYLILVINKLREDNLNTDNDERMKLLNRCLDVFNDDVNSFSSNDMKYLALDNKFSDWRHVYGISK